MMNSILSCSIARPRPFRARAWLRSLSLWTLASCLVWSNFVTMGAQWLTYFGTYTGKQSKGIYVSRFDDETGKLSQPELAVQTKNPSYLALHPSRPFIYAVSEVETLDGKPTGGVAAFAIEDTGKLKFLNQQPSAGSGPCHLSVHPGGACLLIANYGSGTAAALRLRPDGSIGEIGAAVQHKGVGINPKRQAGPHAHQAIPSPDGRFAYVCDLGLDQIRSYNLTPATALLTPNDPGHATVDPGSGPRHMAFGKDGKFAYVINELKSTITTFKADPGNRGLEPVGVVSTLPPGFTGESWCAAIEVHPNGRFLYGSNRGHDSIAVFEIDQESGKPAWIQHAPSGGKYPRFFGIHPSGRWMLSLNQNSGDIVVLSLDPQSGKLSPAESRLSLDSPVCAVFVPAAVPGALR